MIYAGLDLHERFSMVTAVGEEGKPLARRRLANEEVLGFFQRLEGPVRVAMEATRNWYWLYHLLEGEGGQAVPPSQD